jgi:hypothetical protein
MRILTRLTAVLDTVGRVKADLLQQLRIAVYLEKWLIEVRSHTV